MSRHSDRSEPDLYTVLGVAHTASAEEVTRAYRRLVRRLHPDADPAVDRTGDELAQVLAAYEVLGDAGRRAEYDQRRRRTGASPATPPRSAAPATGVSIPIRIRRPDPYEQAWEQPYLRAGPVRTHGPYPGPWAVSAPEPAVRPIPAEPAWADDLWFATVLHRLLYGDLLD